jgi:hypothetical protein
VRLQGQRLIGGQHHHQEGTVSSKRPRAVAPGRPSGRRAGCPAAAVRFAGHQRGIARVRAPAAAQLRDALWDWVVGEFG